MCSVSMSKVVVSRLTQSQLKNMDISKSMIPQPNMSEYSNLSRDDTSDTATPITIRDKCTSHL